MSCIILDRACLFIACSWLLRSDSGIPWIAFPVFPSCVLARLPSEMMRACDWLHLRHRSSYQVRGSIYHAYNFQLTVPSSRIERLLDPTTYIYASMLNLKQPCPSTSQQTMYCYVTLLAAQPLLSMHARMLTLPPITPWFWDITFIIYCCGW